MSKALAMARLLNPGEIYRHTKQCNKHLILILILSSIFSRERMSYHDRISKPCDRHKEEKMASDVATLFFREA